MGYLAKQLRWYKETVPGEKPASPQNMLIQTANAYSLNPNYPSEVITPIGAGGEASPKVIGTPDYSGDIGLVLTGELMPLILEHTFGTATKTSVTAAAWAAGSYIKGDLVSHSDGTHMLYCEQGGITDATEPVLTGLSEYDTVTDGSVKWVVRNLLKDYVGQRESFPPTFGIEMTFDDGTTPIKERYGGCKINTIEFMKSGDDNGFKTTASIIAANGDDSLTNTAYPVQGGTDVSLNKVYFGACDLKILIDDVEVVNTTKASVTVNRNISTDKCVKCGDNIVQPGSISLEGSITCLMDTDTYLRMANREVHKLTFRYSYKGDTADIIFNKIQFDRAPKTIDASKFVMLDSGFSAFGTDTINSVQYTSRSSIDY